MSTPLLSTTRNGVVERLERGHCVIVDDSGSVIWSKGDPDHVTFMRSAAKPLQATALILSGAVERYGLSSANLAVACGSHQGEQRHVHTVLELLHRAGVPPEALRCGTHAVGGPAGTRLAEAHISPTPLHNNCSGKHAGLLASAQALGMPLDRYLDPEQSLQQQIRHTVAGCAGVSEAAVRLGIDGCSAPNFALSMRAIATTFARIARPASAPAAIGQALTRVAHAMCADPFLVQGSHGIDSLLMQALDGEVVSKGGAEGLRCLALPRLGIGLALKIESGRAEGMGAILIALLRALDVIGERLPAELAPFDRPPIRNHRGIVVGDTQVLLDLSDLPRLPVHARYL
jgi:L-asparaginase II